MPSDDFDRALTRIDDALEQVEELKRNLFRSGIDSVGHPRIHGNAEHLIKVNYGATSAPGAGDDVDDGYSVGSRWINITTDKEYVCLDNTAGAAVWTETTGAAGGSDEKVKVSGDDTTADYLLSKLAAGTAIVLTELTPGGNEDAEIKHDVVATGDLHTEYQKESEKGAANGYAGLDAGGLVDKTDLPVMKVSKSIIFQYPDEDMAVGDFISQSAIRVPASSKHGTWTPGTIYVRCTVVGTGTNTILFRTSSTLTGARTTRATVALGTGREASATITWTPADGEYMWVECSAVGGTAPKWVIAQIDLEEAVY